ncbi:hypothetical protein ABTM44_18480, partial [Acinetobacter baumannii]
EVVHYVDRASHQHMHYQIEIKNDPTHPDWTASPEQFAKTLDTFLKKNHLVNRVEIQSFDWRPLYVLHQIDPQVKLAFLVGS